MNDIFDVYSLRARVYPAFLTALPFVLIVVVIWPQAPVQTVWPLAASIGVVFFLANWVRDRGKRLEQRLVREWDGMPTTRMLRWRDNAVTPEFTRRRELLEAATGIPLPDRSAESNPTAADAVYVSATRSLIAKVRGKQDHFKRVQEENTHYGFRRNLLAMKPFGLSLAAGALVFDLTWAVAIDVFPAAMLVPIHAVILAVWNWVVSKEWVGRQGQTYAERLFETMEDPVLLG